MLTHRQAAQHVQPDRDFATFACCESRQGLAISDMAIARDAISGDLKIMFQKMFFAAAMFAGVMMGSAMADHHALPGECDAWPKGPCVGHNGHVETGPFHKWREEEFGFRVSCQEAAAIVRDRGYRKVRVFECGVRRHVFEARRGGNRYLVTVNGYNGDISAIRRIGWN